MTNTTRSNEIVTLPPLQELTVTADASSSGGVRRRQNVPGGPDVSGYTAVAADTSVTIGPFTVVTHHELEVQTGALSYSLAPANLLAAADISRATVISQEDYDALDPPDDATLYLITA